MPMSDRFSLKGALAIRNYFENTTRGQQLITAREADKIFETKTDTDTLMSTQVAQEIMTNTGEVTYLMHATTLENAESILETGLQLFADESGTAPNLKHTTKMMPSRYERGAKKRIRHGVTYRHFKHIGGPDSAAKVVIKFDEPNPGTSLQLDQFAHTNLLQVDGENIILTGDEQRRFAIPPERIMGYFDLDKGTFIDNPKLKPEVAV